ncbi:MAG: SPOR domain-containing protein, partial [Chitinophagales bacterium]
GSSGGTFYDKVQTGECCVTPGSGGYRSTSDDDDKSRGGKIAPPPGDAFSNTFNSNRSYNTFDANSNTNNLAEANPARTPIFTTGSNRGIEFKIQLGAFRNPDLASYNSLAENNYGFVDVEKTPTGMKRIVLGTYATELDAINVLTQIKRMGYQGAFLVKYQDGYRSSR